MIAAALDNVDFIVSNWASSFGISGEHFVRLLLAVIAGGLVGLEREVRGRQAGFRTNVLVCLGSCLVMIVSTQFAHFPWKAVPGVNINVDPARIAYGVMAGIGFLGAGTIIHNKGTVRGLTTAAGLWCIAAVGLAAGFGMYTLTIGATVLILGVLWILDYFEDLLPKMRYRTITVQRSWAAGCINETVQRFRDANLRVVDAGFQRSDDLAHAIVHLRIAFTDKTQYYNFERKLENDKDYQLLATQEL